MSIEDEMKAAELATAPELTALEKIPAWVWSALIAFVLGWACCHYYERGTTVMVSAHDMEQDGPGAVIAARQPGALKPEQPRPAGALTDAEFEAAIAGPAPVVRSGVEIVQTVPGSGTMKSTGYSGTGRLVDEQDKSSPPDSTGPLVATQAEVNRCMAILQCPATHIAGTLVTEKDGTPDLLLSANGQTITSAVFSPPPNITILASHPWAAGIVYGNMIRGGFVDRDLGPVRFGIEMGDSQGHDLAIALHLGWRF